MGEAAEKNHTFPRTHRLRHQRDFDAAYQAGVAKSVGPLRVFAKPNDLGHGRLGLNVSTRVGNAVVRNRVKRLLRESFRLLQHELPGAYDFIVIVRPHKPLELADYQRIFRDAAGKLDREWVRTRNAEFGTRNDAEP